MKLLVFSPVQQQAIQKSLGNPEYSYFFVLQKYLPVLEKLAEVVFVSRPEDEVDALFHAARNKGQSCLFMCFSPPNKVPLGLECPTLVVFAWEFDTLPDETWDEDRRNDWRFVFSRIRGAITLSSQTQNLVSRVMGADYPVAAIPVPIFDRIGAPPSRPRDAPQGIRSIGLTGRIIDSRDYEITPETFRSRIPMERFCTQAWSGERVEMHFSHADASSGFLGGFYAPEPWGAWSRIQEPWIMLPFATDGIVRLSICAAGYGHNAGRKISMRLGNQQHILELGSDYTPVAFDFFLDQPANLIQFAGLHTGSIPGAPDPRTMGLGLRWIAIERLDGRTDPSVFVVPSLSVALEGIVFTSVLNPGDGRKNWGDIVKVFCQTFGDTSDATLVLKMSHHSIAAFFGRLQYLLHRIGTVKCRVIVLHGYLDDSEFNHLVNSTTYYVNASHGEGLCMPLMEFMSAGVPALAPDHTAMADYVSPESTFIVRSSLQPAVWPHDPRALLRACYYRIDPESLGCAFDTAYRVAKNSPQRYRAMAAAASAIQQRFSSDTAVGSKLTAFLDRIKPV